MSAPRLRLFGREQCHLCEQAEQLLLQLGLRFAFVDIDESPELGAQYGLRIPVLALGEAELDWPFDQEKLEILQMENLSERLDGGG